jgi:probable O-glycosylation ligase (exosortase A-associated)
MKHLLFLAALTTLSGIGALYHPFWGVLLYYLLAVLRPQYLWNWSLPMDVRWSLIAAGIAVAGTLLALPRVIKTARFNWFIALTGIFSLLLLLSYLTASKSAIAAAFGIEYAKIIFLALLAVIVIDRLWQIHVLAIVVLLTIGFVAYEVNYLYFIDGRLDIHRYGFGGLDNNGAGLLLAMGAPLAYTIGLAARRTWQRFGCWLLGIFMIHAVMMSYSRGAMVAAIGGAAWLLWHHRPRMQSIAAGAVIGVIVLTLAGAEIRQRFFSAAQYEADRSAQSRLDSWAAGWRIAWDRPIFGQGIRNSRYLSHNFGADTFGRTIHSQYIQVAADSGIPAMLVFIGLLGASLVCYQRGAWICRQRADELEQQHWPAQPPPGVEARINELRLTAAVSLGCAASLVIYAVGAMFLSLELFELPWLLMVMAALLLPLIRHRLDDMDAAAADEHEPQPAAPISPALPRQSHPHQPLPPLKPRVLPSHG